MAVNLVELARPPVKFSGSLHAKTNPEIDLMAMVIISLKLCYGLDDCSEKRFGFVDYQGCLLSSAQISITLKEYNTSNAIFARMG